MKESKCESCGQSSLREKKSSTRLQYPCYRKGKDDGAHVQDVPSMTRMFPEDGAHDEDVPRS